MAVSGDLTALPCMFATYLCHVCLHAVCMLPAAQSTNAFMYQASIGDIHAKVPIFDVPFEVLSVYKLRPDACRVTLNFDSNFSKYLYAKT